MPRGDRPRPPEGRGAQQQVVNTSDECVSLRVGRAARRGRATRRDASFLVGNFGQIASSDYSFQMFALAAVLLRPPLPSPHGARADVFLTAEPSFVQQLHLPEDEAPPAEVVRHCMAALKSNDSPQPDAGKWINWALAGDMIRSIHRGDPTEFIKWTRRSPVFDCMVDCESFRLAEDTLTVIDGTPTRGALCKVVVHVAPREAVVDGPHSVRGRIGRPPARAFLWTLQQQRRPPNIGAWRLYQVLAIDHALELTQ